jgi:hypothetical protein
VFTSTRCPAVQLLGIIHACFNLDAWALQKGPVATLLHQLSSLILKDLKVLGFSDHNVSQSTFLQAKWCFLPFEFTIVHASQDKG